MARRSQATVPHAKPRSSEDANMRATGTVHGRSRVHGQPPRTRSREHTTVQTLLAKPVTQIPDGDLATLRRKARDCHACPLWKRATQTVFGAGAHDARVMLIGEQPGLQEPARSGTGGGSSRSRHALPHQHREALQVRVAWQGSVAQARQGGGTGSLPNVAGGRTCAAAATGGGGAR